MRINLTIKLVILASISVFMFLSCKKNPDNSNAVNGINDTTQNPINPINPVNPAVPVLVPIVDGFIYKKSSATFPLPANGETVLCGNMTTVTDNEGYFKFNNITLNDQTAFIKVGINNITSINFQSIKSFTPDINGNHLVCELNHRSPYNEQIMDAVAGGDYTIHVQTPDFYSLFFPQSGFKNTTTGNPYTGNISVNFIPYTLNNTFVGGGIQAQGRLLYGSIQGSLLGLDPQGNTIGLHCTSYFGKLTVFAVNGEPINLNANKKVTINLLQDLASSNIATPPIYLWHFDESKNRWIQGPLATLNTSHPSHFFTAESDVLYEDYVFACAVNLVDFTAKIVSQYDNMPIQDALVRVNKIGEKQLCTIGYTDQNGNIKGKLPAGENLQLSILTPIDAGPYAYGNSNNDWVYQQNIGSFSSVANLGTIVAYHQPIAVSSISCISHFEAKLVDCSDNVIPNGLVKLRSNQSYYHNLKADNNGNVSVNIVNANLGLSLGWFVLNPATNDRTPLIRRMSDDYLDYVNYPLDTFKVCNVNTNEYLNFTIDGLPENYTPPTTTLKYSQIFYGAIYFPIQEAVGNISSSIRVCFEGDLNVGVRPLRLLNYNGLISSQLNHVNVELTENLGMGSYYITGNFQGLQVKYTDNSIHTISCNFRVRHTL